MDNYCGSFPHSLLSTSKICWEIIQEKVEFIYMEKMPETMWICGFALNE